MNDYIGAKLELGHIASASVTVQLASLHISAAVHGCMLRGKWRRLGRNVTATDLLSLCLYVCMKHDPCARLLSACCCLTLWPCVVAVLAVPSTKLVVKLRVCPYKPCCRLASFYLTVHGYAGSRRQHQMAFPVLNTADSPWQVSEH